MARPNRSAEIGNALLTQVGQHPKDLVRKAAEDLKLSRAAVAPRARTLVAGGYLQKEGSTRPIHRLGHNRRASFVYTRNGLQEDQVWARDIAPLPEGSGAECA